VDFRKKIVNVNRKDWADKLIDLLWPIGWLTRYPEVCHLIG